MLFERSADSGPQFVEVPGQSIGVASQGRRLVQWFIARAGVKVESGDWADAMDVPKLLDSSFNHRVGAG